MARRKAGPRLTAEVIDDPQALVLAIDAILQESRTLRARARLIVECQKNLRGLVSDEGWTSYLALDEQTNARYADALIIVARIAWQEGARSASRRP